MDLIGYWLAIYEGISLTDHFFFKRSFDNYNPADYENPKGLPPGIAAVTAFCFGVAGMVTGSKFSPFTCLFLGNKVANVLSSGPNLVDRPNCQARWW
jgi:purine-cytosine permease-like protein